MKSLLSLRYGIMRLLPVLIFSFLGQGCKTRPPQAAVLGVNTDFVKSKLIDMHVHFGCANTPNSYICISNALKERASETRNILAVSPSYLEEDVTKHTKINSYLAELTKEHNIKGLCSGVTSDKNYVQQVQDCLELSESIVGLKIHLSGDQGHLPVEGVSYIKPSILANLSSVFLRMVKAEKNIVLIHFHRATLEDRTTFLSLVEDFPEINFIFAHNGEGFLFNGREVSQNTYTVSIYKETLTQAALLKNLYLGTSMSFFMINLPEFKVSGFNANSASQKDLIETIFQSEARVAGIWGSNNSKKLFEIWSKIGFGRIVFGSDLYRDSPYSIPHLLSYELINESAIKFCPYLTEGQKRQIFYENAQHLLN